MLAASNWVPILTTEAGLSLTSMNWQEANLSTVVYYLDALLLKPGLPLLTKMTDFARYTNWSQDIILNASRLKANKAGIITLISPFDGSKQRLDYEQLINLVHHLKPQRVILPEGVLNNYPQIWDQWNQEIIPYLSVNDLELATPPLIHGLYVDLKNGLAHIKEHTQHYKNRPHYVQGELSLDLINELRLLGIDYVESDTPSHMGLQGLVYDSDGVIDLRGAVYATDFNRINDHCQCTTCSSKLTRAYLHHLLNHTPLLCQRFLIQHNATFIQHALSSFRDTTSQL
jgi:queuine tRNA-ribosyltransferase